MRKNHPICRIFAAGIAGLTLLFSAGCGAGAPPAADSASDPAAATTPAPETEQPLAERLVGYTLVRDEDAEDDVVGAAVALRSAIQAQTGVELPIATDWVRRDADPDAAGEREILFGVTNRTASVAAMAGLGRLDYVVQTVGDDIVIAGGSDYALEKAAEKFVELLAAGAGTMSYTYLYESQKQEGEVMLRVASYNIRHGADVNMNMQTLADDMTGLNIDVVGLQEVDINASRSGNIDTMKLLSQASGMAYYAFAKGIPLGAGEYGTGILSRWPIVSFEVTPLASGTAEQRSIGHAVLDVNGTQVHFFNTHLSYEKKELRTAQFAQIAEMLPKDEPWVLTGDFNTDDFTEFAVLGDSTLLNRADNRMASFYSSGSAIDNIVLSTGWTVIDDGMLEVKHSDHYMIWCDVQLEGTDK